MTEKRRILIICSSSWTFWKGVTKFKEWFAGDEVCLLVNDANFFKHRPEPPAEFSIEYFPAKKFRPVDSIELADKNYDEVLVLYNNFYLTHYNEVEKLSFQLTNGKILAVDSTIRQCILTKRRHKIWCFLRLIREITLSLPRFLLKKISKPYQFFVYKFRLLVS